MITTILLLPSPEMRDRLLVGGKCGSEPPCAWYHAEEDSFWPAGWLPDRRPLAYEGAPEALVLAWDNAILEVGVFMLWYQADDITGDGLSDALYAEKLDHLVEDVSEWRKDDQPLGTILCLDANGQEVVRE